MPSLIFYISCELSVPICHWCLRGSLQRLCPGVSQLCSPQMSQSLRLSSPQCSLGCLWLPHHLGHLGHWWDWRGAGGFLSLSVEPVQSIRLGIWLLHCGELRSLPTSTSEEVVWVFLAWKWSGGSLGEWSCFPFKGMARKPAKGCSNKGVPARVISGKEGICRGEVTIGEVEAPDMDLGPVTQETQVQWDRAQIW